MSLPTEQREQARQRAGYVCEYCGVSETDTAGTLTVDHFHPQSKGGGDDLGNLIYCCHACNGFKSDHWPQAGGPMLWNPRREAADTHLLEMADGRVFGLTALGDFAISRLRLNRTALVAYRLRRVENAEQHRLMARLGDVVALLEQMTRQHTALLEENRALLQHQKRLLQLLVDRLVDQPDTEDEP